MVADRAGKGHHVTARVSCTAAQRCSSGRTQGTATEMIWLADPPIETAVAEAPGAAGDQSENGPASTIGVVRTLRLCGPHSSCRRDRSSGGERRRRPGSGGRGS
jgi:hypothetical protein